jgi:hypothetical protein
MCKQFVSKLTASKLERSSSVKRERLRYEESPAVERPSLKLQNQEQLAGIFHGQCQVNEHHKDETLEDFPAPKRRKLVRSPRVQNFLALEMNHTPVICEGHQQELRNQELADHSQHLGQQVDMSHNLTSCCNLGPSTGTEQCFSLDYSHKIEYGDSIGIEF